MPREDHRETPRPGERSLAFAVGDVAGKSTPAALLASLAVGLLRGHVVERPYAPDEMLADLKETTHVVADLRRNQILLRGPEEAHRIARELIDSVDHPPTGKAAAKPVVKVLAYPCPKGRLAEMAQRVGVDQRVDALVRRPLRLREKRKVGDDGNGRGAAGVADLLGDPFLVLGEPPIVQAEAGVTAVTRGLGSALEPA